MSRSFKHTPRCGDDKSRGWKQIYNRRLRAKERIALNEDDETMSSGSRAEYKKVNNGYDICDFESLRYTFEEYWDWIVKYYEKYDKPIPDKKQAYRDWYKQNLAK